MQSEWLNLFDMLSIIVKIGSAEKHVTLTAAMIYYCFFLQCKCKDFSGFQQKNLAFAT